MDIFVVNFVWLLNTWISSCGMLPDIDKQKLTSQCNSAVSVQFWRASQKQDLGWSSVMPVCWSVLGSRDTVEWLRAQCNDVPDCMLIPLSFAQPLSFSFTLELNIGLVWISFDFDYIMWTSESAFENILSGWISAAYDKQCMHHSLKVVELLKWYTGKKHVISLASGI